MGRMLVFEIAFLCFLRGASSIKIDRADGGYEDIQVAISKDVPYEESIIEKIKELFWHSSEFLHKATNGRVYFKKVVIEIPHTWPKRAGAQVVYESNFQKCDVRIDMPTAGHGDQPFTAGQDKICGKSSGFIQLTPGFLAQNAQSVPPVTKRNLAYVFVHEWAHMRYGVFDEYGRLNDPMYPLLYCSGKMVHLNACSGNLAFRHRTSKGENCRINRKKCVFADDCLVTIYSAGGTDVESSIMFMPYLKSISHFCNGTTGNRSHNADARTAQNALCSQKSTWEVIAENDDFQGLPEPSMSKLREVIFQEKQTNNNLGQRVVLALDVSASMHEYERLDFLQEAVTRYINDLKDGSVRLAIVIFSDNATVLHPLVGVNASTRQGFLNAVAGLQVDGFTCIGCAIEKALELLNTPSEKPEGAIIVVLTDGEENREPNISTMTPEVQKAKVTVNTVAVGPSADLCLVDLAVATEGRAFTYMDGEGNLGVQLESAFLQSTTAQADEKLRPLMVLYETINFTGKLEKKFPIDRGLGKETKVIIKPTSFISAPLTPWLVDPRGNKCQKCRKTPDGDGYVISIPSPAKVGIWKLHLETNSPDNINVTIQVRSRGSDGSPIEVFSKVTCKKCTATEVPVINARVTKGKLVVLDAAVQAEVIGPKGLGKPQKWTIQLFDDGQDPDNFADDGTYSNYFVHYKGPGRYTIKAHVSDQNETATAVPSGGSRSFGSGMATASEVPIPGGAKEFSMDDFITDNTLTGDSVRTRNPVESFQRVEEGGSFEIIGDRSTEDLPPGNIRDLRVADLQPGSNGMLLVQLTWTWPGAHLTYGNASGVMIRAGEDFASLKSNFDNQTEITRANVAEGNLDPLPSRVKHFVTIVLPETFASLRKDGQYDWTAYIAIRVTNSYGRSSETSNVVKASYKSPSVTTGVAATTKTAASTSVRVRTTKEATAEKEDGESSEGVLSIGALVVIIVAVALVIAIIVIAVIVIATMNTTNTDTLDTPGEQQPLRSTGETVKKCP